MRSAKAFVSEIHRRAELLYRKSIRRQIMLLTVLNAGLLLVLTVLIGRPHRLSRATMAGTSLLDESTGGYVAIAVLSFMLGAAVTLYLRRYLKKYAVRKPESWYDQKHTS